MCKNNFDKVSEIISQLNSIEDELKGLRDCVGLATKKQINQALEHVIPFRDRLHNVDKALEQGGGV